MKPILHIIEDPAEMKAVEALQTAVWGPGEAIPGSMLLAAIDNGGLLIGAYIGDRLVGLVFGFPGLMQTGEHPEVKHCSHMLAVLPEFTNLGIGFDLKRAQWQMVRSQGIELITWTYDPLLSRNAHLNIDRLGGICGSYAENYYGDMEDLLNAGLPSDRFIVEQWVNSTRVIDHMRRKPRPSLDLGHYFAAGAEIINPTRINSSGNPVPPEEPWVMSALAEKLGAAPPPALGSQPLLYLMEIPSDFQGMKTQDPSLARAWRFHTRALFKDLFTRGYLVTDFIHLRGSSPRSFYLLSDGGRILEE